MKSITDEKDIDHPFSYNHYCAIFQRDTENLIKHFMALNQHDNMRIQKLSQNKENSLNLFSYDGANQ